MELLQLLVEHNFNDDGNYENHLSQFCTIKHKLPILGIIAVEITEGDLPRLLGAESTRLVYSNAVITTQNNADNTQRRGDLCGRPHTPTGKGIGIAILDTGVAPVDDLILPTNRLTTFVDMVNNRNTPYDDNAHGTHVAGIAAGSGFRSEGRFTGTAPESNIIAIKVLDESGKGSIADVLAGIEWMIEHKDTHNIRVANLSIGIDASETDDTTTIRKGTHCASATVSCTSEKSADLLVKAVEMAWDSGIVMCVAAGNNGPDASSVTSPGISKKVITVGACDDDLESDMRPNFSGRGPTSDCIIKPDCLAPGCSVISCLSNSTELSDKRLAKLKRVDNHYARMSGTSMSSPYVAGAIALLLEKKTHLTPDEVKLLIKQSCRTINEPYNRQGWGIFDITKLV